MDRVPGLDHTAAGIVAVTDLTAQRVDLGNQLVVRIRDKDRGVAQRVGDRGQPTSHLVVAIRRGGPVGATDLQDPPGRIPAKGRDPTIRVDVFDRAATPVVSGVVGAAMRIGGRDHPTDPIHHLTAGRGIRDVRVLPDLAPVLAVPGGPGPPRRIDL